MFFSQTAIYALRALSFLGKYRERGPMRAKDLSEHTGVPIHYLSKIMRRMVEAGLVFSQKGHGGGFIIARPLEEISLQDIISAVDGSHELQTCVFGWDECNEENPCPLHPFWCQFKQIQHQWLEGNTLADIVENRRANIKLEIDTTC